MDHLVLLAHAGSTVVMCGLIWFVQIVHYPLYAFVGREGFARYEREHVRRTGWVVGPPMMVEGLAAVSLALGTPAGLAPAVPRIGLLLLVLIWGVTALVHIPAHRRLQNGFADVIHRRLVGMNWMRTILWTIRAVVALWIV